MKVHFARDFNSYYQPKSLLYKIKLPLNLENTVIRNFLVLCYFQMYTKKNWDYQLNSGKINYKSIIVKLTKKLVKSTTFWDNVIIKN